MRHLLSDVLSAYGFCALMASAGNEGVEVFARERPDAVLLDLRMPGMSGIETLRQLRNIDADIPVIVVSAYGDIPTAVETMKEGAYDFIVKPPDYKMLIHAINRAIEKVKLRREVEECKGTEEALRRYAEQLKALSYRLVEVQEEERRYMAKELHDEIGQGLTGLKLCLETVASLPCAEAKERLGEIEELVGGLLERVRNISLDLRPSMLDDLGLLPALLWHFKRYTDQTNIRITLRHSSLDRRFGYGIETAAYRIVQEALTNVARHASVGEAEVEVRVENETLVIRVRDAGAGFDPGVVFVRKESTGLSGMKERLDLLGGILKIESSPGAGTSLTAEIPLPETGGKGRHDKNSPRR